jgi:tagatose 6-phosphate kinase
VARTLHALGVDVLVLGLAGGITGAGMEAALRERCVPAAFTPVAGETRRTFSVVDDSRVTAFYEPGPTVGEEEFAGFRAGTSRRWTEPPLWYCPAACRRGWSRDLRHADSGRRDTRGAGHARRGAAAGAAAGAAIVKPNLAELESLTGHPLATPDEVIAAAGQLAGRRPWWSRSARTGCWPRPATAAGGRGRPPPWPGTRPARATRWPRR